MKRICRYTKRYWQSTKSMADLYYDLHIHSCLSPCADDLMSPNNIVNMAMIKELDVIAVSDHNSVLQQDTMDQVAKTLGMTILYGIEVETREEIHVLAIFRHLEEVKAMGAYVSERLPGLPNNPDFFGKQEIKDVNDETTGVYDILLLQSIDADLNEVVDKIHAFHGKAILAHIYDRLNSIHNQLGFIPFDLDYDAVEVKNEEEKEKFIRQYKSKKPVFMNSDAHYLTDIKERERGMDEQKFREFFGLW